MIVEKFEKEILENGFQPIYLVLKAKNVKWFVCKRQTTEGKEQVVIFDKDGEAYVAADEKINTEILDIRESEKGVTVNGKQTNRVEEYDLCLQEK